MNNYIETIGIEVHVELKTNTKIFSPSRNGYGMGANTLTNVVDLGMPGTLPLINKEVINIGIKAATVLNCNIRKHMHFDRKNYFYPDNPKNYQITQARTPIGYDGYVEIEKADGTKKKILIEEIHIEEDTCKSAHRKDVTLLDFNRAGVPLIEIVTKPCIESAEEAKLYIEKLRETLLYADISDCKMEEGSMRCDANISLRKSLDEPLGTKVEIKNIGSISNVYLSLEKEKERQAKLLDNNETFKEQTRRFDSKLNDTVLMRYKETGNDYRYFPEPDIPYINLTDEEIKRVQQQIPMMPDHKRKVYEENNMTKLNIEHILLNRDLSDFLDKFIGKIDMQTASNLLLGDIASYLNRTNKTISKTMLTESKFIELVNKVFTKELTSRNVKDILDDYLEKDITLEDLIKEKGIENISDTGALEQVIDKIISDNKESVNDYITGHDRAFKFFMGMVMKETKGSANPSVASKLLKEKLDKLK